MAPRHHPNNKPPERGIWKKGGGGATDPDVKLADFSYENEDVAQEIIVRAWGNPAFKETLLGNQNQGHTQTPQEIADRVAAAVTALSGLPNKPFTLKSAIVLTEAEYNAGWDTDDNDQVVFVLPNRSRATGNLLETAKMLMACVPNGI